MKTQEVGSFMINDTPDVPEKILWSLAFLIVL